MTNKRPLQVGSVIKKNLVEILHKLDLKYITISEVKMSPDLKYADIFFFPLQLKEKTEELNFEQHLPLIKQKLSKLIRLRYLPKIRFKLDNTFDNFSAINSLLEQNKIDAEN
ncbi:MAG: ribosome-binding factor A [Rickettsiaceae bacterium H1]|nr:ribosome-binding factor A [Rickettsiaceae bacterium H1]